MKNRNCKGSERMQLTCEGRSDVIWDKYINSWLPASHPDHHILQGL